MAAPFPSRRSLAIEAKPTREGQKTRIFHADLIALVAAPGLHWEFGSSSRDNSLRPVLLAYAATDQEARAFTANLRTGRPAVHQQRGISSLRIEIPRSAGFRYETFSLDGGSLTFAYLPWAFSLQPAAESGAIRFLCMPPTWWIEREAVTLPELGPDAREAALAAHFVAYLDHRSPLPIANDLRFHLALYRAALAADWCHRPQACPHGVTQLYAEGHEALGLEPPLLVSTTHAAFSAFLAEQTARHLPRLQEETTHGQARVPGSRRLFPHTAGDPARHRLAR
jgi:hypothetical protein